MPSVAAVDRFPRLCGSLCRCLCVFSLSEAGNMLSSMIEECQELRNAVCEHARYIASPLCTCLLQDFQAVTLQEFRCVLLQGIRSVACFSGLLWMGAGQTVVPDPETFPPGSTIVPVPLNHCTYLFLNVRQNWLYNLFDVYYPKLLASTASWFEWDDHEVTNNEAHATLLIGCPTQRSC